MQPFESYFKNKMADTRFKAVYDSECNVCASTVVIFEKAVQSNLPLAQLADDMKTDIKKIKALRDADHCDPTLVIRLCRHLGIAEPAKCPRLNP